MAATEDDPNVFPEDTPVTFGMLTEALANLNRGLSASLTQSLTTALNSRIDSAIAPAVTSVYLTCLHFQAESQQPRPAW